MGCVQHQPEFALAVVGAAQKAAYPHSATGSKTRHSTVQCFATDKDRQTTSRFAHLPGFVLLGVVFQHKPADRQAQRRITGLERTG